MNEDSDVVKAHYAPGEERTRYDLRTYGLARCVLAAAWADTCSSPADAPSAGSGDGSYDEIAELVMVYDWMNQEALARALGMDLDGAIEANQGDIDPIIADRIAALRALAGDS